MRIAKNLRCLVFLVSLACGAVPAAAQELISPQQAWHRAKQGALTIVDVRTPAEWRQSGLPQGAAQATILPGEDNGDFLARIQRITGGDKAAPIAMICRSGRRSHRAALLLRSQGYTNVKDIEGGYMNGWRPEKLPEQPCKTC